MQQSQFDQIIECIRGEETLNNVDRLRGLLRGIKAEVRLNFITFTTSYEGDEVAYVNLAGAVFMEPKLKPKILDCILEAEPCLLLKEGDHYPAKYRTPLHVAIKSRNPEMVTTVLTHPIFTAERNNNVEAECSRLVRSYMWALLWYYETRDAEKIQALKPTRSLPENILKQKAPELLVSQEKILALLLEHFKASMWAARLQGKDKLQEQIMQMCVMDSTIGEGYWQHTYGLDLRRVQQEKAIEICRAFFTEEELRQGRKLELGAEPPPPESTSALIYIGAPLLIGLGAILLWKVINRCNEQGCVIS